MAIQTILKIKQEIITGNGTQVERPIISNETGGSIAFKAKNNSGVVVNSIQVLANAIIPGYVNGTETQNKPTATLSTMGTAQYPWQEMYAKDYIGLGTAAKGLVLEDDVDAYVFDFTNGVAPPANLLRKPSKAGRGKYSSSKRSRRRYLRKLLPGYCNRSTIC